MFSLSTLIIVGGAVAILLLSGRWADRQYSRFDQIPAHYNFRGEATRLAARKQTAWALPVGFSLLLIGLLVIFFVTPAEMQNGDPNRAMVFTSIMLLAAQAFVLKLLKNWADQQN